MIMRRRHASAGQTLVEFALVAPIFFALLLGMVDLGRVIWANNAIANGAREGARFAIVHGGSAANPCPVGPPGPDTQDIPASVTCPHPSPSKEAIRDVARGQAFAAGGDVVVQVCYGAGCSGDTDAAGATNVRGTPVTVTVISNLGLVTGTLAGWPAFGLSSSSTMLVNH
jgi:hypothetical protein